MRPEDNHIFDSLEPWQAMGLCIEREAGGEPREGKIAVGTVILERVDHRKWDGQTIREVVFLPWQFSWTMPEAGEVYYKRSVYMAINWTQEYVCNPVLKTCCDVAEDMISGEVPRDPDLAAVHCCQYLNPVVAWKTRDRWIKAGMQSVKVIARHEFFKEA